MVSLPTFTVAIKLGSTAAAKLRRVDADRPAVPATHRVVAVHLVDPVAHLVGQRTMRTVLHIRDECARMIGIVQRTGDRLDFAGGTELVADRYTATIACAGHIAEQMARVGQQFVERATATGW
jgi:hypothetical protein